MKRTIILILPLCLLFAVGCKKDNSRISIFAENMSGVSKVWVNPANVNGATWIAGETINLNGNVYTIASDDDGFYVANTSVPLEAALSAVYPATTAGNGNDVTVENSSTSRTVTLNSLAVNFNGDGHDIVFPMAAYAASGSNKLLFQHLTGGLKLNLTNATATSLYSLKVITYGDGPIQPVILDNITVTTRWAEQGPNVPTGGVGQIEGDYDIKYCSEMNFTLMDNGNPGVEVPTTGGGLTFCVPVTVCSVKRLVVIGYNASGTPLFTKTMTLANAQSIERNHMYPIPSIQIN